MSRSFTDTEKAIIKFLLDNSYSDKKTIEENLKDMPEIGDSLEKLAEELYLIELASPMESSLESRVPKSIYLVNPEKESELEGVI